MFKCINKQRAEKRLMITTNEDILLLDGFLFEFYPKIAHKINHRRATDSEIRS